MMGLSAVRVGAKELAPQCLEVVSSEFGGASKKGNFGAGKTAGLPLGFNKFDGAGKVGNLKKNVVLGRDGSKFHVGQRGGKDQLKCSADLLLSSVVIHDNPVERLEIGEILSNELAKIPSETSLEVLTDSVESLIDNKRLVFDGTSSGKREKHIKGPLSIGAGSQPIPFLSSDEGCRVEGEIRGKPALPNLQVEAVDQFAYCDVPLVKDKADKVIRRVLREPAEITALVAEDAELSHCEPLFDSRDKKMAGTIPRRWVDPSQTRPVRCSDGDGTAIMPQPECEHVFENQKARRRAPMKPLQIRGTKS